MISPPALLTSNANATTCAQLSNPLRPAFPCPDPTESIACVSPSIASKPLALPSRTSNRSPTSNGPDALTTLRAASRTQAATQGCAAHTAAGRWFPGPKVTPQVLARGLAGKPCPSGGGGGHYRLLRVSPMVGVSRLPFAISVAMNVRAIPSPVAPGAAGSRRLCPPAIDQPCQRQAQRSMPSRWPARRIVVQPARFRESAPLGTR